MRMQRVTVLVVWCCGFLCAVNVPPPASDLITIEVDVSRTAVGIIHSHLRIPTSSGTVGLAYPKWVPGQHSPKGPINEIIEMQLYSQDFEPI